MIAEHVWAATAVVALPAGVGGLLLALPRSDRAASIAGIASSVAAVALLAWLMAQGVSGVAVAWEWAPSLSVRVAWRIDATTLALATLVAGVGALVLQVAGRYFGPSEKGRRAIGLLCVFQASMLGLVLSDELLLVFTFWELTGICSFFLILTDSAKRDDTFPSAQQALIVTVAGALPMLLGFLYLIFETGTGSLSALARLDLDPRVQTLALALILPGVLTKSAQAPFHFWLPGAMAAPTPISAYLHSATMVKAGLILLIYLFPILGGSDLWSNVLIPLGAITCIWGSYQALRQDDVKLLMAWSTVSQLGLITITAGLGTDLGIRAAILYLLAHAVFKAGLFLSIAAIDHAAGTRKLSQLGGLGRRAPILCVVVAVLSGSMAGLPPFAGFLSKELVLEKLLLADTARHDIAVVGIVLGSIGTAAYTARFFFGCFLGSPRSEGAASPRAVGAGFLVAPGILAVLSLAGGMLADPVDRFVLEPMSNSALGYVLGAPKLALWHGITVPLVLSAAILTIGYGLYRLAERRPLPAGPAWLEGSRIFAATLAGAQSFGTRCGHALAGASPSVYLGLLLAFGLFFALPLVGGLPSALSSGWHPGGTMVFVLLAFALGLLVSVRSKVGRILVLTAVGFAVANLYRLLQAPDLMLTQLLVEVLTTVFLVIAVRFVADREPPAEPSRWIQGARMIFAGVLGIAGAGLVVALQSVPKDVRVANLYYEAGPDLAEGNNLVNLVLGDFRALDTLIETLVVLVAALGVIAFLRGRELSSWPEVRR